MQFIKKRREFGSSYNKFLEIEANEKQLESKGAAD
jgi:hypothetical protein